ncbi:MAG: glycosyltransferase family 2 protein, partial [Dehalococcoidia bacterium]|nr:glycosyltransferase family 2 protein [Dehalococcoidia bacterium]
MIGFEHPEITVVVPVYRNSATLRELYSRLRQTLSARQLSYEIVFVDDACPEASLDVLREIALADERVAVLVLERNVGQHRAVLAGLSQAQGQYIVVMDADLQDPPEAIPALLSKLKEGYAAVFAGRRGRYESRMRLFTSVLFKRLLALLSGVPPDAGMFVAMNRQMADSLLTFDASKPFVVAMIGCTRLPLTSIPVRRTQRHDGRSAYSSWKRFKTGCLALLSVVSWRWGYDRRAS